MYACAKFVSTPALVSVLSLAVFRARNYIIAFSLAPINPVGLWLNLTAANWQGYLLSRPTTQQANAKAQNDRPFQQLQWSANILEYGAL